MNEMGSKREPFIFIIDFNCERPEVIPLDVAAENGIYFHIGTYRNKPQPKEERKVLHFRKNSIDFTFYEQAYEKVLHYINRGDTYLLNLTFPTEIDCNYNLEEIFDYTHAKYKLLYKDEFVIFSPETFVRIDNGCIYSYPMKGTIDAGIVDARAIIFGDPKETAEHNTIVDLIRNDLSRISQNVRVTKFRYLEEIRTNFKTLLQLSSEIRGELPLNYHEHLGDILQALLPAGSISGAPKKKTVEIIHEVENYKRGFYTGVCGIFDGNKLDSGVMIRYIENTDKGMVFKSGGGITFLSEAPMEFQELIDKVYVPIV